VSVRTSAWSRSTRACSSRCELILSRATGAAVFCGGHMRDEG
jgi:hypothetical protein